MLGAICVVGAFTGAGCAADPPSSVVGIVVDGCGSVRTTGSGVVVDDDLVLTSAHTLRGATSVVVEAGRERREASVVGFDPDLDLAYLRADLAGIRPTGIVRADDGEPGFDRARAWAVRDGTVVEIDVDVVRAIRLETEDIYVEGATVRPAFELRATLEPGDSGGPILTGDGVVGVLWARSTRNSDVAYAIDAARGTSRLDAQLVDADLGDVDLHRCD